ncbi:methylmalonyl-CoA mutase family protein [Bacillus weihaiensis]|uniref:Methylmalonyl-CoA mutase alpha/beta chain catalytic domain-containing protein n=1 Tax=Bacillus weihaiensis TaxID=1547283 RepID=A0A1L3MQ44_9BACI|nr:methylmalonyl-CoA mutase family protein [Bacillus weihaiensis]APH04476.1 hypothetical protein A9C19_06785 [Bacillus weihaiensis]
MGEIEGTTTHNVKKQQWISEAENAIKGSLESLHKTLYEGIKIKPLYDLEDVEDINKIKGMKIPLKESSNSWNINQLLSADTPLELNEKINYAKSRGQHSFYLTNFSFIRKSEDLNLAFQSIDWKEDTLFFDVKSQSDFLSQFLYEQYRKKRLPYIKGFLGFDPYEELLTTGESDLTSKLDFLVDVIHWKERNNAPTRSILVKGNLFNQAGGDPIQQLTYTFSEAYEVMIKLMNRGLSIDLIARHMVISFDIGPHFFMEIAKIRAAKQLWVSLLHALGCENGEEKIYIHASTSVHDQTAYDVYGNLLRSTTAGFSAAVAGVDELTILPFDSVLKDSSPLGERIARNTHFILRDESFLSNVIDPSSGSYYIETITHQLAEQAWAQIKMAENDGGFEERLKTKIIQKELQKSLREKIDEVNDRTKQVIGINVYANVMDPHPTIKMKDSSNQIAERDDTHLSLLTNSHIPLMRKEEKVTIQPIQTIRYVEHIETLRQKANVTKLDLQSKSKIFVVTVGLLKNHKTMLDKVSGILAVGGLSCTTISFKEFEKVEKGVIYIFCGKESDFEDLHFTFIRSYKKKNPGSSFYITSKGTEQIRKEYPIDGAITDQLNIYDFLQTILSKLEDDSR